MIKRREERQGVKGWCNVFRILLQLSPVFSIRHLCCSVDSNCILDEKSSTGPSLNIYTHTHTLYDKAVPDWALGLAPILNPLLTRPDSPSLCHTHYCAQRQQVTTGVPLFSCYVLTEDLFISTYYIWWLFILWPWLPVHNFIAINPIVVEILQPEPQVIPRVPLVHDLLHPLSAIVEYPYV